MNDNCCATVFFISFRGFYFDLKLNRKPDKLYLIQFCFCLLTMLLSCSSIESVVLSLSAVGRHVSILLTCLDISYLNMNFTIHVRVPFINGKVLTMEF